MKNLHIKILIFVLFLFAMLLGFNYIKKPFAENFVSLDQPLESAPILSPTPNLSVLAWEKMSAKQRILQLIAAPVVVDEQSMQLWLKENPAGLVTLFGENVSFEAAKQTTEKIKQQYQDQSIFPLFAVDHEGGKVQRLSGDGFEKLPSWHQVCESTDSAYLADFYQTSAQQLSKAGINIIFAPVVDLASPNGVLADRVCGGEKEKTVEYATRFIYAFAQHNIMSVIKHFPGIGQANKDLHYNPGQILLRPEDADVFKEILDQFPNIGVMTAHITFKDVPIELPCSLSDICLAALREQYKEAVIFSDALDMESALTFAKKLEASESAYLKKEQKENQESADFINLALVAKQAIAAGNDVLVFGKGVKADQLNRVVEFLLVEYEADSNFAARVDKSSQKIMNLKKVKM